MPQEKPEVKSDGVCREIWYALGVCDALHTELFGKPFVVTSMRDGVHNLHSLHPSGKAVDLRVKDLSNAGAVALYESIRAKLKPLGYDVIFEGGVGATPATTGAHIHVEYDPKPGESFESRVS